MTMILSFFDWFGGEGACFDCFLYISATIIDFFRGSCLKYFAFDYLILKSEPIKLSTSDIDSNRLIMAI